MSGPKVIRIVTRDEIIAVCEGHLRNLDQAIEAWICEGKRIKGLSDEEISATLERRKTFDTLLTQDAFMDLQKRVPDEIAFLTADGDRRRQIAIDKIAQAKKRQRQGRDTASTLIASLKARAVTIPADLITDLESIASGSEVQHVDTVLARGFMLLTPQNPVGLTDAQRTATASLMVGLETQDFATWKSKQASMVPNSRIDRIDHQIAELGTILEMDTTVRFVARLRNIETMETNSQQNLLLDSLILDLASALDVAREQRLALAKLKALAATVRAYGLSEAPLLERIDACTQSTPSTVISEFSNACENLISQTQQDRDAEVRRRVILQGLAKLGYDINEGMETAWARDGQVIAKKSSLPGYGVEIGGQAQSGRLQVRSVALTDNRDSSRDKDVETIWCGEFTKLQELLAEHGDNLIIERALGIGAVPLKVVNERHNNSIATQSTRTMN